MPDKYQKEIEEILMRVEETRSSGTPIRDSGGDARKVQRISRRPSSPSGVNSYGANWLKPSPLKIAGLGLGFLLVGFFIMTTLVWVGLGLLVLSYLMFFIKPRSTSYEKRWRGRPIAVRQSGWEKLKSWFKK